MEEKLDAYKEEPRMYINRTENRPRPVRASKKSSSKSEGQGESFFDELESALIVDAVEISSPEKRQGGRQRPQSRRQETDNPGLNAGDLNASELKPSDLSGLNITV